MSLSIGNNNAAASHSGVISGSGSLTKIGTGNQTLSGTNSYTGGTVVSEGTLTIVNSNNLGSGTIAINNGSLAQNDANVVVTFNQNTTSSSSVLAMAPARRP